MTVSERVKSVGVRVLIDLLAVAVIVGGVLLGHYAYHGEQAYQYILAAQRAAQQRQAAPAKPPTP